MKWDPSHSFRRLLISQIALTLVYPLLFEAWGASFLLSIFIIFALYGGISVTTTKPIQLWISSILGACFVGFYWVAAASDVTIFNILRAAFGALFFGYIAAIIMNYIFFYRSKIDIDLIYGAVSVYLLIGSTFGEVYLAFAIAIPDAFSGIDVSAGYDKLGLSLGYYSFVTLTTLGYGDITPQLPYTKVLAYVQAVIGQLYLTILVARLVGTYIAQSQKS